MKTVSKLSGGMGLSQSSQRDILVHLARCPELFHLVRTGKIRQEDINGNLHRFVFVAIHSVLDTSTSFNEPIPKFLINKELLELITNGDILREEVGALSREVETLYASPVSSSFYDESYIMSLIRKQRMSQAIGSAVGSDELDPETFQDTVVRIISESKVDQAGDEETGMLDQMSDCESMGLLPQAGIEKIPTGIPTLDFRLYGGLAPRKTGMVCAYTGVGKSAMTVSLAVGAAQAAFPTLIFSTELGKEEFYRRTLSHTLNISYTLIEHGGLDSNGRPIDRNELNRRINDTRIQMMRDHESIRTALSMINIVRSSNCTIDDYKRKVRQVSAQCMDRFGIPLRLTLVDWLDKMQPSTMRGKDPALRHFLAQIVQEIDDFNKEEGLAGWVTTQANDSAAGKAKVGMTSINESRAKAHPVSLFCGLGTSEQDRENGIWHLNFDKNRDGTTFTMRVMGDLDHQKFSDLTVDMEEVPIGIRTRAQRRSERSSTQ